ncbi:MAG: response regulator [Bryobacteraceae bacterium]
MTVLVADDNEKGRELLEVYLGRLGYTVVLAATGRQAVDLARAHQPDLLILDVRMPEMSGYEVVRALRAEPAFSCKPILALTASVREEDRCSAIAAGFSEFHSKPMSLESIRRIVARLLSSTAEAAAGQ